MNSSELAELVGRINKKGMIYCLIVPLVVLVAGYLLIKENGVISRNATITPENEMLIYVLFAMSFFDPIIGMFLKRQILSPKAAAARFGTNADKVSQYLETAYIPLFALAMSTSIYGAVCYFMGANLVAFVVMVLISPVSFMILRANEAEIETLLKKLEGSKS